MCNVPLVHNSQHAALSWGISTYQLFAFLSILGISECIIWSCQPSKLDEVNQVFHWFGNTLLVARFILCTVFVTNLQPCIGVCVAAYVVAYGVLIALYFSNKNSTLAQFA